jgi:hypothetical protein
MKNDEILDLAEEKAVKCEFTHHGCSQCVLLAIQEAFDMKNDMVFKAASGLAGGIGRMHSVCEIGRAHV